MDIYDIEALAKEIHDLKAKSSVIRNQLTPKINLVKQYMIDNKKKNLKVSGFSLSLAHKKITKYDNIKLKQYIDAGDCPSDVILNIDDMYFLTICSIDDIELIGNKFVVKKR